MPDQEHDRLKSFLDSKVDLYNRPEFISGDPISVPHKFSRKQDIEISGFLVATIAWGQRKTIVSNGERLMSLLNNSPYDFIINHSEKDLKPLLDFAHRTFQPADLLYFISFLRHHYNSSDTLEDCFRPKAQEPHVEGSLSRFHNYFFSLPDVPLRTRKHVATPAKSSSCKRLNMFLRWMVRDDGRGVDFGLWKTITPAQLICPVDVHVGRVARSLGLISRKQSDWRAALELTEHLTLFDSSDPVKYDFALFGLGVIGGEL